MILFLLSFCIAFIQFIDSLCNLLYNNIHGNLLCNSSIITLHLFIHSFSEPLLPIPLVSGTYYFREWEFRSKCTPFGGAPAVLGAGIKGTSELLLICFTNFWHLGPHHAPSLAYLAHLRSPSDGSLPSRESVPQCKGVSPFLSQRGSLLHPPSPGFPEESVAKAVPLSPGASVWPLSHRLLSVFSGTWSSDLNTSVPPSPVLSSAGGFSHHPPCLIRLPLLCTFWKMVLGTQLALATPV